MDMTTGNLPTEAWIESHCQSPPGTSRDRSGRRPGGNDLARSFHWRDAFHIGHSGIDQEHRRFFEQLANAAQFIDDPRRIERLFLDLFQELLRHLADEERVMDEVEFTGLAQHRLSHNVVAEQAKAALTIGCDGEWATALRLLGASVLEHVTEEDFKLRPLFGHTHSLGGTPSR